MKAKLDFKSKRTIIITAIIAALAIGAGVGAYFYAKGNNEASATTNTSDSSQTATDEAPSGDKNKENPASNNNNGNENGETNTPTDGTGDNAGNDGNANNGANANENAGNNGQAGNENGGNGANGNGGAGDNAGNNGAGAGAGNAGAQAGDNDGDATTTTENIVVEEPWESHSVNWRPQTFNVLIPEVNVNQNKITVTKTATTSTGNNSVSAGDIITYTITATNSNSETLNSLYISDEIPEGTTFATIENGGKTIKENEVVTKVYWNLWNLGIESGKTYSVSFTVTVNNDAKGTIRNVAIAEGEPSNKDEDGEPTPTENPVFESSKTSVINRIVEEKETMVKEPAQKGDKITYTISVKNTGDVDGTTKIVDEDLKEILNEEKGMASIVGDVKAYENDKEKTAPTIEQLISGYEETISKNSTYKVVYTIELKNVDGNISNTATIGNTPSTEVVETTDLQVQKEVAKIVRDGEELNFKAEDFKGVLEGDIIIYTITVKNNGSTDLHDIVVEESLDVEGNLEIKNLKAGETKAIEVTYTLTAKDINDKREVKNVVTATGKTPDDEEITSDPSEVETPVEKVIKKFEVEKKVSADNKNFTKDPVKLGNGETAYFQIRIKNNSNVSMNVDLTDVLSKDEEITGEDLLSKLTYKDGTAFENGTTLKPGEEIFLYASKEINQEIVNDANKLTNTITATGTETNPEDPENPETTEPETDTAEVEVKKPIMVATKKSSAENTIVKPGDTIKYTIKITNSGETTGDIEVIDNLPEQVTFSSARVVKGREFAKTATATESEDKKQVKINVIELSNEKEKNTVEVEIETIVNDFSDEDAVKGVEIKNEIKVDGETPENGTTTDTASKPVISVEKSSTYITDAEETDSNTKKIHAGDEIVYTMIVKNLGLVEKAGLKIEDPIPARVTLAKKNAITVKVVDKEGKEVNSQLGEVTKTEINDETTSTKLTWLNATIGAEQTATITVKVTVDDLGEGEYSAHINKNTVTVDKIPGTDDNEYDVVAPAITVEKEVKSLDGNDLDNKTVSPGTQIKYLIIAKNENGTEAGDVTITDTLDTANLTNISAKAIIARDGADVTEEIVEIKDGIISKTYTINPKDIITIEVTATTRAFAENEKDSYIIKNKAKYVIDEKEDTTDEVVVNVFDKRIALDVEKTVSKDNKNFAESVRVGDKETAYFKIEIKNNSNIEVAISASDVMTADGEAYNENMTLYIDSEHRTVFTETTLAKSGEERDRITLYAKQEINKTIEETINIFVNTVTVTGTDASEELGDEAEPVTEADTAEVEIKKPNITFEKKVKNKNSEEEASQSNTAKIGDTLVYTIELTNTGDAEGTVTVTDSAPGGTTLAKINDNGIPAEDGTISWNVTVPAATSENKPGKNSVSFEVIITDTEKTTSVTNTAEVDGTPTNDTETKVANITTTKSSVGSNKPEEYLHENDTITYTLTITNNGNGDGTVKIADRVPTGTTIQGEKGKEVTLSKVISQTETTVEKTYAINDLVRGIDVNVKSGETKTITFTVKINPFTEDLEDDTIVTTVDEETGVKTTIRTISNLVATQDGTTITPGTEDQVEKEYVSVTANKEWSIPDTEKYEVAKGATTTTEPVEVQLGTVSSDGKTNLQEDTTTELNEDNDWTVTYNNLDKYDEDGNKINYTIDEVNAPSGYIKETSGSVANGFTIKNTLPGVKIEKTVVSLNKKTKIQVDGEEFEVSNIQSISVKEDDIIGYEITVNFKGDPNKLESLVVTDNKEIYLTYDNAKNGTGETKEVPIAIKDLKLVEGDEYTASYTVYYKIKASETTTAGETIENIANVKVTYKDGEENNTEIKDSDDAEVIVADAPGISVEKQQYLDEDKDGKADSNEKLASASNEKLRPGDVIIYNIIVTNTGNTVQKNVKVTDTMTIAGNERNITIKENSAYTVNEDGTVTIKKIAIGDSVTITATYTIEEDDMAENTQTIKNVVTIKPEKPSENDKTSDEVTVKTEEWRPDISLNKTAIINDSTDVISGNVHGKAEYGDTIKYTLSATNDGDATGTAVLSDADLADLVTPKQGEKEGLVSKPTTITIKDFDSKGKARTTTGTYEQLIGEGFTVNVPAGKTATVEFEVTVTGWPGDEISNSLATIHVDIDTIKNIKVKSNTGNVVPANYVVIVDTSSSMTQFTVTNSDGNTQYRLNAAKDAIKDLAGLIFADSTTKSTLTIVQFNKDSKVVTVGNKFVFTASDYSSTNYNSCNIKKLIDNLSSTSGTNIASGLKKAGEVLYGSYSNDGYTNTNVHKLTTNTKDIIILLSDGEPHPSSGDNSTTGLAKVVKDDLLDLKGSGITNSIYGIAFGDSSGKPYLNAIAGKNHVFEAKNKDTLYNKLEDVAYSETPGVAEVLTAKTQQIYSGTKALASDKKVKVTYGTTTLEYEVSDFGITGATGTGTTSDGILTYTKSSGGTYSLIINITQELKNKDDIEVTYYVR